MFGLKGWTAIEDTSPLSLLPPSEIGLGPKGVQAVPLRAIATPLVRLGFYLQACLLRMVSRPWAGEQLIRAAAAIPQSPWRMLRESREHRRTSVVLQSVDARHVRGPCAGDADGPSLDTDLLPSD